MENQVVVLKSTDIKDAVKRCNPKIIAVAYLGYDWKEYINDPDNIDYMIISPTNKDRSCEERTTISSGVEPARSGTTPSLTGLFII
ncbi:hypothetical protein [Desulfobotulus sp.]|uniref:hypothetical protein n=1 Tax=Desulfobotulus sp. TaxID=1940337 RepID=UPI002A358C4C|nr:hypothetical protein [Desulfobotulus sp.]MDY0162788.1 hypothetical protein [Desulfobotulus sp.]